MVRFPGLRQYSVVTWNSRTSSNPRRGPAPTCGHLVSAATSVVRGPGSAVSAGSYAAEDDAPLASLPACLAGLLIPSERRFMVLPPWDILDSHGLVTRTEDVPTLKHGGPSSV